MKLFSQKLFFKKQCKRKKAVKKEEKKERRKDTKKKKRKKKKKKLENLTSFSQEIILKGVKGYKGCDFDCVTFLLTNNF